MPADRNNGLLDASGERNRPARGRRPKGPSGQPETTYGVSAVDVLGVAKRPPLPSIKWFNIFAANAFPIGY